MQIRQIKVQKRFIIHSWFQVQGLHTGGPDIQVIQLVVGVIFLRERTFSDFYELTFFHLIEFVHTISTYRCLICQILIISNVRRLGYDQMGDRDGQVLVNPILLDGNIAVEGTAFQYIGDVPVFISQKELIVPIICRTSKSDSP